MASVQMGGSLGDTLDTRLDVRYLETTETDNRYQYQEQLSAPSRHMPVSEIRSVCPSCVDPGPSHFISLVMICASWWNAVVVYSRYYFHIFIFHEVLLSSMEPRHPLAPRRNAEGEVEEEDEVAGSSGSTTSCEEWGPGPRQR